MAATRVSAGSGTTSASVSIPNPIEPDELIVVDWLCAMTTGAGAMTVTTPLGQLLASETSATNGKTIFMDFSGGWPLWNALATDGIPGTSQAFTMAGTTISLIHVGYHYEKPSFRRT